jgi:hypothetical protein
MNSQVARPHDALGMNSRGALPCDHWLNRVPCDVLKIRVMGRNSQRSANRIDREHVARHIAGLNKLRDVDDFEHARAAAPFPTREQERAQVAQMRRERQTAVEAEQGRQRAHQDRLDRYAAYGPSMRPASEPVLGPSGDFHVEFHDRGRFVVTDHADDYGEALRKAKNGLLGSLGDTASVFLGKTLVNMAHLERAQVRGRGTRDIVRFAAGGEKPRKRAR